MYIVPYGYSRLRRATLVYVDKVEQLASEASAKEVGLAIKQAIRYSRRWMLDDDSLPAQRYWDKALYETAKTVDKVDFYAGTKELIVKLGFATTQVWPIEIKYEDSKHKHVYTGYIKTAPKTYDCTHLRFYSATKLGLTIKTALLRSANSLN